MSRAVFGEAEGTEVHLCTLVLHRRRSPYLGWISFLLSMYGRTQYRIVLVFPPLAQKKKGVLRVCMMLKSGGDGSPGNLALFFRTKIRIATQTKGMHLVGQDDWLLRKFHYHGMT